MKPLPTGETENGIIYPIGKDAAYFFSLNSSFYCNCIEGKNKSYEVCTYAEFKVKYPNRIEYTYRMK